MTDIDNQDTLDAEYLQSLSEYVKTLPALSSDQIKAYDAKLSYLETIHNEIRLTNKNFMPIYDPSRDREESPGNKYLDIVYRISSFEKSVDSH